MKLEQSPTSRTPSSARPKASRYFRSSRKNIAALLRFHMVDATMFSLCPRHIAALLTGVVALIAPSVFAQPSTTLRVMSYNIHHGEGLDKKIDLERIAKLIIDAKADLVALQEVDRGVARSNLLDIPVELAKLTGLKPYFEKNIPYKGGEYGNAILTRFPIKSAKNTHYKMLRTGEQRGVLQLMLDVHGRDVLFLNTHIDYRPDDAERILNVEEMKQIVAAAGPRTPVILCGDFNSTPDSRTYGNVKAFLADTWERVGKGDGLSFPASTPVKRIDYIWITPETIAPMKMEVLRSEASDHLPVVAELRLK
jgi:endonuclease/exonuclease/phosphatase family metal-dependent hydrolase